MIVAIKEKIKHAIDIKSVTAIEIVAVIVIAKMMAMMIAVTKKKKEPIKKISFVNSVIGKKADQVTEIVTIAAIKKIEMPIGMITIYANLILIPLGFLPQKKSPKNIEQIMKNLFRKKIVKEQPRFSRLLTTIQDFWITLKSKVRMKKKNIFVRMLLFLLENPKK